MGIPNRLTDGSAKRKRCAPGPKGTFFWGSLGALQNDSTGFLSQAARDHGDIVRFRFGPFTAHLLNRPEYVEHVLSRNAGNYDKLTRSAERIRATCGDSLLFDGPVWQRHRRLIQPVFQPGNMADIAPEIDAAMAPFLGRWREHARKGTPVDIVSEMMRLLISTSVKILFSSDVDADKIDRALAVILADTWRRIEAPFDLSQLSARFHRRAFKDAVQEIDDIVFDIIRDRRHGAGTEDDVLSRLLQAHQTEGEAQLSDLELRDAAVTLLLAGHETTANALARAFFLVAQSPGQGFENANPKNLFAEAIRLYPSIWIIERRAIAEDEIAGCYIPKGSSVLMSPYVLHRRPEFWPDPERFDPSRFEGPATEGRPRNAYIPFGLGAHRCVGLHMANNLAARIIGNVYQQFRLRLLPDQDVTLVPGITLRHEKPVQMWVELAD